MLTVTQLSFALFHPIHIQVAIESVQESGISWEQYRKSVYGFLDEQNDEDEMRAEHEERKWH